MAFVGLIIATVAFLFLFVVWARFFIEIARSLRPDWKPKGLVLTIFVAVLVMTDPFLKPLRRWIKPVRIGAVQLDLSLLILLILTQVVIWIGNTLMAIG
ncbi:YggT family protein [Humidisolicoccus flavus]|uniref:YggT family protein n=1 Tax=Humidisolicoccus flavus TaxID=3111414 RepID=UPI0032483292